ncbi:MAG: hypothetical protein ABI618_06360 [Nitrospirota bacterium]
MNSSLIGSRNKHRQITVAEEVFRHIYRAYPTVPSPYFSAHAGM